MSFVSDFLAAGYLEYPTPILDPISGFLKRVRQKRMVIEEDGNLEQTIEVHWYTNNNGAYGIPVADWITAHPDLSDTQKARERERYRPYTYTGSTRGYMIDPRTEARPIVPPNQDGTYPAYAVEEKMAWLIHPVAEVVFGLSAQSMGNMEGSKRF